MDSLKPESVKNQAQLQTAAKQPDVLEPAELTPVVDPETQQETAKIESDNKQPSPATRIPYRPYLELVFFVLGSAALFPFLSRLPGRGNLLWQLQQADFSDPLTFVTATLVVLLTLPAGLEFVRMFGRGNFLTGAMPIRQDQPLWHRLLAVYIGLWTGSIPKDVWDAAESAKCWQEAAERGVRADQFKLGMAYCMGLGVAQDYGQALRWLREAAERGDPDAEYNLGLMYGKGQGVPARDPVSCYQWTLVAASSGNLTARDSARNMEALLPAEQVAEGKRRASEFKPKR